MCPIIGDHQMTSKFVFFFLQFVHLVYSLFYNLCRHSSKSIESQSKIDFKNLLNHFQQLQKIHHQHRINQRKRTVALWDNGMPRDK